MGDEREMFDDDLRVALGSVEVTGSELVLDGGATRVIYERFIDSTPEELFAVLVDAAATSGRGEVVGNVWILADEMPGTLTLTNDAGDTFTVNVVD